MNGFQKAIKILAICLSIFIIANIIGVIVFGISIVTNIGMREEKVIVENFSEAYQNVSEIDIESISSNIIIKLEEDSNGKNRNETLQEDEANPIFSEEAKVRVEASNLKNNFTSKLKNGTLKIEESKVGFWGSNSSGVITIYIPKEIALNELKIDSGAGKIEIENIVSEKLDLDQGAGILKIANCKFNKTDIDGGTGEIKIQETILNDMNLDAGVGKIELNAKITGNSKIECGIGEMNIGLIRK